MLYKTICLELLEQRPQLHHRLRKERKLLAAMESLAIDLKARHAAWKEQLSQAKPRSDPAQIASKALDLTPIPKEPVKIGANFSLGGTTP